MGRFTDIYIRSLKPTDRRYDVREGDGFGLRVEPTGAKVWHLIYTLRGSRRRFVIGPYPEFTLAQAREAIADARKLIARGIHPIDQRRAETEALEESARLPTLAKFVADEWLPAVLASDRSESHIGGTQRIAREIVEALGPRRVREVTRRDLVLLLDRIDQRAPAVGGKARTALRL